MLLAIMTAAGTCIDPAAYGAVPDDGKFDNVALQQAIDAAAAASGKVCLGKGVFHVEAPTHADRKSGIVGSLTISKGPIEIYGTGPQSILRMAGPGARDDWRAIQIKKARKVHLHDFAIDGLDAHETEEQTHLIEIVSSNDITVNRMTLGPMRRPDQRIGQGIGGDCIRLLGKIGAEVTDVMITNSTFTDCDRSGVSLQRSLRRILIAHDTIQNTGDQGIDFEPTGKGSIEDVTMLDLTITHHPDAQGNAAVTIGGHGAYPARRITLADSRITGAGVRMLDAMNVQILRNKIDFGARKGPTIAIVRHCEDIRIAKNTIVRPANAMPGPVVIATPMNKYTPRGITFEDNVLRQETPATIINAVSVGGLVVQRNKLVYTGTDPRVSLINVSAIHHDVSDLTVVDNTVDGEAGNVLAVNNGKYRIRAIEVRNNTAPRTTNALQCKGNAASFENVHSDAKGRVACAGVALQPIRPTKKTR